MKLSAPVYYLKGKARNLSRKENIPLHAALDRIARNEGFSSWSLLAAKTPADADATVVYRQLHPGDLLLLAARPGQGKTLFSVELAIEAIKAGSRAYFLSLEYTQRDIEDRLRTLGTDIRTIGERFFFDASDDISADHVTASLADIAPGSLVVVDYLQLLDQKRAKPDLETQVKMLKSFAKAKAIAIVFLSQVSRDYDEKGKPFPTLDDVRLPNPLDLTLFDKHCFIKQGRVHLQQAL